MQLVMAAITTAPCRELGLVAADLDRRRLARGRLAARPKPRSLTGAVRASRNASFIWASATRSCGRLGPARLGSTVAEVELQGVGEDGLGRARGAEEPLLLAVALDEVDLVRGAARCAAGSAASRRRRGRSRRWRRTPGPCSRWWRGRPASSRPRPGPKNSTNFSTTPFLRRIWVTVSTRSVAVTPSRRRPVSRMPIDLRRHHVERLAEHHGLGLDAAHAPAQHAEAVDHRGVRVGADQGVREGDGLAALLLVSTPLARNSRFTWWTMPVAGGTTRKFWKAFWPQRRNS